MSTLTERLELLITSTAKGVASDIKGVGDESGAAAGTTSLLQKGLNAVGAEGVSTGTALKLAAATSAAFVGTKLVEYVAGGISEFADLTGQVRAFQRVSGATAEDSSKLVFATKELGIAPDAAASAFGRLATRLGTGKIDLAQYGVEVAHNKDGTVDLAGTVANLSDAYQKTEDPTTRAALANEAFGKSWQTLAPLLGKGKDDLKAIYAEAGTDHQIFSQDDLEKGRLYTVAIKQLGNALTGLKIELGEALVPVVTSATSGLTEGLQAADKAAAGIGGLGGAVGAVLGNFNAFQLGAHGIAAGSALMAGHFEDAGKNALEAIPGIGGYASALFDGSGESNKFTDAQDRQKKAVQTAADLAVQGKTHTKEYKDAMATASSTSVELATASQKLADSLQTEAEKAESATSATLTLLDAHLKAEGSVLAIGDAQSSYAQALQAAADAGGTDADANRKVAEAALGVASAVESAAAAKGVEAEASSTATTAEGKHQDGINATKQALLFLSGGLDSTTKAYLQPYIDKLNAVPANVATAIWVAGLPEAHAGVDALRSKLESLRANPWVIDMVLRPLELPGAPRP